MKHKRSTLSSSKGIGIRKLEFVAKTQFLWKSGYSDVCKRPLKLRFYQKQMLKYFFFDGVCSIKLFMKPELQFWMSRWPLNMYNEYKYKYITRIVLQFSSCYRKSKLCIVQSKLWKVIYFFLLKAIFKAMSGFQFFYISQIWIINPFNKLVKVEMYCFNI